MNTDGADRTGEGLPADAPVGAQPPQPSLPPPPAVPQPVPPPQPGQAQVVYQVIQPQPANGVAVAGLVLGILGVLIPFLGILGLIFGAVGLSKANRGAGGKGMAIAGLVLGIIGTLITIAILANAG